MAALPASGLVEAAKAAGAALAAASGLLYACGYLVLRARAHALGTEPGFTLIDQAYVFAGFRFGLIALIALVITAPLLVLLRAAARGMSAALNPAAFAGIERIAVLALATATLGLLYTTLQVSDTLLSGPQPAGLATTLRDGILGRNQVGMLLTLVATALAGCSVLWVRTRYAEFGGDTLALVLLVIAALLVVLLPMQHGVFYADRKARVLERAPEGLGDVVPPVWQVDRGRDRAVLLACSAAGKPRLITVKDSSLDGVAVTGTVALGHIDASRDRSPCAAKPPGSG